MRTLALALTFSALSTTAVFAQATSQTQATSQQERVQAILGALFGNQAQTGGTQTGGFSSLDAQWAIGLKPLAQQRTQFETRIDSDVRTGALGYAAGDRAKADYRALVDMEARYGADRRFSPEERAELSQRYNSLTQVIAEGGYAGGVSGGTSVANGRAEFEARVDQLVRDRRMTRAEGTQRKTEYYELVRLEADYMRDGVLSVRERDQLESRLDALDAAVGIDDDRSRTSIADGRADFEARVDRLVFDRRLTRAQGAQLKTDYYDLTRLEADYLRDGVLSDRERDQLESRLRALNASTGSDDGEDRTSVAQGRAGFEARVDRLVRDRRMTSAEGARLKTEYYDLTRLEADYLRDGVLSDRERDQLERGLAALDARVPGGANAPEPPRATTPAERLDAVARAVTASGLSTAAQAQLRVEHEDLRRLAAAYDRLRPTTEEQSYLEGRIRDLETRVRLRR